MRSIRGFAPSLIVFALVLTACGSSARETPDGGSAPGATSTGATAGPTGPTNEPTGATGSTGLEACALVTEADASSTLDGSTVELVEDPVGEGLLNEPLVGTFESVCYYRPVPDDGDRQVATVVFTPGSISEADFEQIVADGSERGGGFNFDIWVIDQTMLVRKADVIVIVRATTDEGSAPNESAEYELALLAAVRIPADPEESDVAACRLLTSELVGSALGDSVVPSGGAVLDDQTTACGFAATTRPTAVLVFLTEGSAAATQFEDFRRDASGDDAYADIDGLGDAAFQSSLGVSVLAGDAYLDLRVLSVIGDEDNVEASRSLAEAVVDAL
jgi:hypothetical protein